MKCDLETLQRGIDDDGEIAHLFNAIVGTEISAEKIESNHAVMIKEVKMATNAKRPKGPKGYDDILRINTTTQDLFKEFLETFSAVVRFADLVGAARCPEFERVESEGCED